jgi:hypothetical protein
LELTINKMKLLESITLILNLPKRCEDCQFYQYDSDNGKSCNGDDMYQYNYNKKDSHGFNELIYDIETPQDALYYNYKNCKFISKE